MSKLRHQLVRFVSVVAFAASAETPLFFEGQLTDEQTERPLSGTYELEQWMSLTPDGAAVTAKSRQTVTTDRDGYYSARTPSDVSGLVLTNDAVYLNVAFYDKKTSALVTRLPAQCIGYAPYALHAGTADRMQAETAQATTLALAGFGHVGTFTTTDGVDIRGTLIVTNELSRQGSDDTVGVVGDVRLGTLGSALLAREKGADVRTTCSRGKDASVAFAPTFDGVFELVLASPAGDGRLSLAVTDGEGTVFECDDCATDGGTRRFAWPVHASGTISVTVGWSGEGTASVDTHVRYFGVGK